jgi:hypothetical protein
MRFASIIAPKSIVGYGKRHVRNLGNQEKNR